MNLLELAEFRGSQWVYLAQALHFVAGVGQSRVVISLRNTLALDLRTLGDLPHLSGVFRRVHTQFIARATILLSLLLVTQLQANMAAATLLHLVDLLVDRAPTACV